MTTCTRSALGKAKAAGKNKILSYFPTDLKGKNMKKIAILGSTGSIGTQALDIIDKNRDCFSVSVLSCASKIEILSEQIERFQPEIAVTEREADAIALSKEYPATQILFGVEGLVAAAISDSDLLLNALVGIRGLAPTYHAIETGKDIALANKETLVAGGSLVMKAVREKNVKLLPVDSEHSAIFQCLQGNEAQKINRLILTASGGPFRGYSLAQLEHVTSEQALKHPNWNMGSKITIDSATMMNKGLEMIEAAWLFDMSMDQIEVAVHPQSIIHSMVEFKDHSIIAQLGLPDMRIPISYALHYPQRLENDYDMLNFFKEAKNLTFEEADFETFKCIKLAREAFQKGGSYPVVLNGANEVLVQLFLEKKIKFTDIQNNIQEILEKHNPEWDLDLGNILEIDQETRIRVLEMIKKRAFEF